MRSYHVDGGERVYRLLEMTVARVSRLNVSAAWLSECPAVAVPLRGEVVAKTASVWFQGIGRLQMFPSQQAVHTWSNKNKTRNNQSITLSAVHWSLLSLLHCNETETHVQWCKVAKYIYLSTVQF